VHDADVDRVGQRAGVKRGSRLSGAVGSAKLSPWMATGFFAAARGSMVTTCSRAPAEQLD
jgi:hypothetical protein